MRDVYFKYFGTSLLCGVLLGIFRMLIANENDVGAKNSVEFFVLFRDFFEQRIESIFPDPYGSIMDGILTGARKNIPYDLMQSFNHAGITHIIAVSGYNISIVIAFVSGLFSFLGRKKRAVLSIVFVILFVMFVGASASTVRAGIMGIIALAAMYYGRTYLAGWGILLTAFVIGIFSPNMFFEDVGFQLSLTATAGLVFVSPLLENYFKKMPDFYSMKSSLLATLSAQISSFPIIISVFGTLSIISPLTNLLILPLIPLSMLSGFVAVILSIFSFTLANFVGFFGYIFLKILVFVAEKFGGLHYSTVEINYFPWWIFMLYYFFLVKKVFRIGEFCLYFRSLELSFLASMCQFGMRMKQLVNRP
ncbi:MAG: ComEC/Rec2 family competence protein [Candidatus Gracilibacteria bacterium]